MLFKSALLTQASGSIGGMTASHNAGGLYLRARTIPTDPNTSFQATLRAVFALVVGRWAATLTAGQRADWEVYASLVTLLNPLGDPISVSGFNMYVRANVANIQAGLPLAADAPSIFDIGPLPIVSFTVAALLDNVTTTFDNTDAWAIIDDGALLMFISRPQNATINFFKGPFRALNPVLGDTAMPPTSPDSQQGPFTMTAGQRVWMKVRATLPDGRLSASQILGPIVVT